MDDAKPIALTDDATRRAVFIDEIVRGLPPEKAARVAGYEPDTARRLLLAPAVRKALIAGAAARLEGQAVPAALTVIQRLLDDPATPAAVAAKLALGVLDRAGVGAKSSEPANPRKDMEDMSQADLEAYIAQAQRVGLILDVTPGKALKGNQEP